MLAEEIIKKYEKNLQEQSELLAQLKECSEEEWDWVCVRKASEKMGMSINLIYDKVNAGKIQSKRFNGKILVSIKELMNIDDSKAC